MTAFVLIWEDRRVDTDVQLFGTKELAVESARRQARDYLRHYGREDQPLNEELTASMERDGWLYFCRVDGDEGPTARVMAREVQ